MTLHPPSWHMPVCLGRASNIECQPPPHHFHHTERTRPCHQAWELRPGR
jgi:hypothetical protein